MTIFQKEDLFNLLTSAEAKINKTFDEAKKIDDLAFWRQFKDFKRKRIRQMYEEEGVSQKAKDEEMADALLSELENI